MFLQKVDSKWFINCVALIVQSIYFFQPVNAEDLKPQKMAAYQSAYTRTVLNCLEELAPARISASSVSFLSSKKNLIEASSTESWTDPELKKALNDDQVSLADFESRMDRFLGELQSSFVSSIKPMNGSGGTVTTPVVPEIPARSSDLIAKITDLDPLKNDESLFQLNLRFRDHYYPDGLPTTDGGFDRLAREDQINTIQNHMQNLMIQEIQKHSLDYRNTILTESDKTAFQSQWLTANKERLRANAELIAKGNTASPAGANYQFALQPGFSEKLRTALIDKNQQLNASSDLFIRSEPVDQRKKHLAETALEFIQKNLVASVVHPIRSIDELDAKSSQILNQYLAQYSKPDLEEQPELPALKPVVTTTPETANQSRISQFKGKVFNFLRGWMRVQSVLSIFTGGFGLEEFFLNKIIEALEEILGSSLSPQEKAEARVWATELAREAPVGQPLTINPSPNPVAPTTIGLPAELLPLNPVILRPIGSGHHFRHRFP